MYSLPSTSKTCDPWPRRRNGGVKPTLRNALTGELTPPGIMACAFSKSPWDLLVFMDCYRKIAVSGFRPQPAGHHAREPETHADFVQASMEVLEESALQPDRKSTRLNSSH